MYLYICIYAYASERFRLPPFKTVYSPLSYSGNPGVTDESYMDAHGKRSAQVADGVLAFATFAQKPEVDKATLKRFVSASCTRRKSLRMWYRQ